MSDFKNVVEGYWSTCWQRYEKMLSKYEESKMLTSSELGKIRDECNDIALDIALRNYSLYNERR